MSESNAQKIINNSIARDKVFHSYIFVNENEFSETAVYLTQQLLDTKSDIETHPSVIFIDGNNDVIKKVDVINASKKLQMTSTHEGNRVLFIKGIERGNKSSLNSLLKLIEEPQNGIYIIMTTSNVNMVIQTIVSRSQVIFDSIGNKKSSHEEFRDQGMSEKWIPFYSQINLPSSKIMEQYNSSSHKQLKDTMDILSKSLDNKSFISGPLGKIVNKDNFKFILFAVDLFYNDIWKLQQGIEPIFYTHISMINAYSSSSFKYDIALRVIRDFMKSIKFNVNFTLAKANMLIKLEEAYG